MQNRKEDNFCTDSDCYYGVKKHKHIVTSNGSYVKFIVEKAPHSSNPRNQDYDGSDYE